MNEINLFYNHWTAPGWRVIPIRVIAKVNVSSLLESPLDRWAKLTAVDLPQRKQDWWLVVYFQAAGCILYTVLPVRISCQPGKKLSWHIH